MAYDTSEILEAYRRKWEIHRAGTVVYKPPVYKCSQCKDMGYIDLYPTNPHKPAEGKISTVMYCPYCRIDMLKDMSGIIAEYRELDIAKFPWGTYKTDISKLKQTLESFVYDFQRWRDEGIGLYIYSAAKGSGKTMVANAICGSICMKYNMTVRFTKAEDFLADVKKSYDDDSMEKTELGKYYNTELLVLDDLGVTEITKWGQGVLHDLINERYKAKKLCIITSNYDLKELPVHPATKDRLNDMCLLLQFPEEPIRSRKANERKNRLLQHIENCDKFTNVSGKTPFENGGTNK